MKIHHQVDVTPLRAAAYMPAGDQLDAILKGFVAMQAAGIALPAETLAWIAHCQAVKDALPKTN